MLSKEERKAFNEHYWLAIKKALNKTPDAHGRFIQWLNYPTKIKEVYLRFKVDNAQAAISIDIQSKDDGVRSIIWEQFTELKWVMEKETGTAEWLPENFNDAGLKISTIRWTLPNVSIYEASDQESIIDFFKEKITAFDRFYKEFGEIVIQLVK
jgi:hypothetical protein